MQRGNQLVTTKRLSKCREESSGAGRRKGAWIGNGGKVGA